MKFKLAVTLALINLAALATDIRWLKLHSNLLYSDPTTKCSTHKPGEDLYFSSEIENGKLTRAILSNFPYVWPYQYIYKNIQLTPKEMSAIELYKDSNGRYWLKKFPVTSRLLKWILFVPQVHSMYCVLPVQIQTSEPQNVDYQFETDGIDDGVYVSYSQKVSIVGQREDQVNFTASLQLEQEEYENFGFPTSIRSEK